MNFKLVLASSSPRRAELLASIGLEFEIVPSGISEEGVSLTGAELVCDLAYKKALKIAGSRPDAIVIGADTVVIRDGVIFGKPPDETGAACMLSELSGVWHEVFTGISVIGRGKQKTEAVLTRVKFRKLNNDVINAYVATGEPMDKAGAYGIQGLGSLLVEEIAGDYYNVMGLPLGRLAEVFSELYGISFINSWKIS